MGAEREGRERESIKGEDFICIILYNAYPPQWVIYYYLLCINHKLIFRRIELN